MQASSIMPFCSILNCLPGLFASLNVVGFDDMIFLCVDPSASLCGVFLCKDSIWVHIWDLTFCIYIALTLFGTADYPGAPVQVVRRRWENLAGSYRGLLQQLPIYSHSHCLYPSKPSDLLSKSSLSPSVSIRVPLSVICYNLPFSFCPFQSSPFVCII